MDDAEARAYRPRVVHVDADNRQVHIGHDPAEPVPGAPAQLTGRTVAVGSIAN